MAKIEKTENSAGTQTVKQVLPSGWALPTFNARCRPFSGLQRESARPLSKPWFQAARSPTKTLAEGTLELRLLKRRAMRRESVRERRQAWRLCDWGDLRQSREPRASWRSSIG
jgi:hypothetical protein